MSADGKVNPEAAALELLRRQVAALAERLRIVEGATHSLNHGVSCHRPLPLGRPEHAELRDVLAAVAARRAGDPVEPLPYVMPVSNEIVGGRVA
jgi:hypothetical protein